MARQNAPSPTTRPLAQPPGYDLPEKLEAHANAISGSHAAKVCQDSAVFIRTLICENTDLKRALTAAKSALSRVNSISGSY